MQKLLEEVAFKVRKFYDSCGSNLEKTSMDIINMVSTHINDISKIGYEEVSPLKPAVEGECILIHSLNLNKPIIFGTVLTISTTGWTMAGRTYSPLAVPQVYQLDLSLYGKDWIAYRVFLHP